MSRYRGRIGVASVVVAALVLGACGDDETADSETRATEPGGETTEPADEFAAVVAAGEEEGSVMMYAVIGDASMAVIEQAFEADYPNIDMQWFRASNTEVVARVEAELTAGGLADVLQLTSDNEDTLGGYDAQGDRLVAPVGPSFASPEWPATQANLGAHFYLYAGVFGWAWNTEQLPDGIDGWDDILSPDLAGGRIALLDPTVAPIVPGCYRGFVEAVGDDFLDRLAAQDPVIHPAATAIEAAVVSGEVAATMFSLPRILDQRELGASVEFATPPEGACVTTNEAAILANAPHPNAAQVLADWLVSERGQQVLLSTGLSPVRSGLADVDFADLVPTLPATAEEAAAFVAEFDQMFR